MVLTKIPGELIADNTIATADLADNAVTTAKIANTAVTAAKLTSGAAESGATGIKSDIALLAFKTQANGNLAKYNLVDQAVDSFEDASGVNSSASTNATRDSSGKYYSGATSAQEALTTVESSTWTAPAAIESTMHLLVVGGGGASSTRGNGNGGAGAGGLVYISNYAVTGGQAYTYTVGAGAPSVTSSPGNAAPAGDNSVFDGAGVHQTITANGGGRGSGPGEHNGGAGGSGGGGSNMYNSHGQNGATNQPTDFGSYTGVGFGFPGGAGSSKPNPGWNMSGAGGGGAGAVGQIQQGNNSGGAGGVGKDYSSVFGTGVGESGWFAGGGGGGGGPTPNAGGAGGNGGGGDGGTYNSGLNNGGGYPGTANTGGGGGGAGADKYPTGGGGSGVIVLKYNTLGNMTLVSNSTTAEAVPTKGDVVLTYTNNAGTATLNTDLIASVSRDNGTTYTAVTLAGQGTTGGQTIASASGVDISGQPSGTAMVWKVATANQSGSKKTFLNGVSLGWA